MGEFPSGQRGQTVNLLAMPSVVRIHLPPLNNYRTMKSGFLFYNQGGANMRTLYYNGKVYTGELPLTEAFIVEDGHFSAVGQTEELRQQKVDRSIDLEGRFVCAGFNDSHMHLLGFGISLLKADLARHTGSLQELIAYLKDYFADHSFPEGKWLEGRGWNQDYFSDVARMPDRFDLDEVSTEIPILITRCCGHACVVNTKALELAGITAETVAPVGGAIGLEQGEPDGRFYDNAIDLITGIISGPDMEDLKAMLLKAAQKVHSYGITSVQTDDYIVFADVPFEMVNQAYQELTSSGQLQLRVYEQCNFTTVEKFQRFLGSGLRTGQGTERFKIGPLKLLGDGALGSRTAHLSKPYLGTDDQVGFDLFTDEQMEEMVALAHKNGMQIAVHAIGDACLDQVLRAMEKALHDCPREDHRHGIVHCQISRADQLRKIEELGLQVYAQSVFLDYDNHIVEKLVVPEIAQTSYHWKSLIANGVRVSNGSDCPVELPDVMKGIECAVTRTSLDGCGPYLPEEAFTVQEALDSFTWKGAEASFEEDRKGRIAPGQLADFVILAQDPFETKGKDLHTIPVKATVIDGQCVYGSI